MPAMRVRFSFLIGAIASVLTGCAAGPDYKMPVLPANSGDAFLSGGSARSEAEPPDAWWKLYDDPVATSLVEQALQANGDLRIAMANLEQAQAVLDAAQDELYPTTTVSAGEIYGRNQISDALAATFHVPPRNLWTDVAGAGVSYEVDLFGRVRRSIEAAHEDAEAAAALRDAMRVTVVAATMRAYAQACSAGEQANDAAESLELAKQAAEILGKQRQYGSASQLDVERSEALVENARAAVPPLLAARRVAAFELAYLTGRTPAQVPAEALNCAKAPLLSQPIPVGNGATLVARRPDVRAAERLLAASTARIGIATAALYPSISLGVAASYADNEVLRGATAFSLSAGPLISWNFPNLSVARARVREAGAVAEANLARFDDSVLQALKETEQALSLYAAELDRQAALASAESRSAAAYQLAEERVRAGSGSHLEAIVAEQTLIAARLQRAASGARLAENQIAVFKALGGGWRNTDSVSGTR